MKRVAIIGGGACGLWCANTLKRRLPTMEVVIFERFSQVGKKILMSGNSKGNLSNLGVAPSAYNNPDFVAPILNYDCGKFIQRCHEFRLETFSDDHGRVYPLSETAASYVTLMHNDNQARGVITMLDTLITDIKMDNGRFIVNGQPFDYCVIAIGSKAGLSPKLPDDSFPTIDGQRPFKVTPLFPSLSSLGVNENIAMLNGMRVKANLKIVIDGVVEYETDGELQFIEKALSGIAVFELSSFYARRRVLGHTPETDIFVDVCPRMSNDELASYLIQNVNPKQLGTDDLVGLLPSKLSQYVHSQWRRLTRNEQTIVTLVELLKSLKFTLNHDYMPTNNQIFAGGISLEEIDSNSLETHRYPNMYIGGEVLNIDGMCGGYNLHFAFAAGEAIANSIADKERKHE